MRYATLLLSSILVIAQLFSPIAMAESAKAENSVDQPNAATVLDSNSGVSTSSSSNDNSGNSEGNTTPSPPATENNATSSGFASSTTPGSAQPVASSVVGIAKSSSVQQSKSSTSTTTSVQQPAQSVSAESSESVSTKPSPTRSADDVMIFALQLSVRTGYTAIEIYNTSDEFIDLSQYQIELKYSTASSDFVCDASLHDFIRPQTYYTLDNDNSLRNCPAPDSDTQYDHEIVLLKNGEVVEAVRFDNVDVAKNATAIWARKGITSTYRSGVFTKDFGIRTENNFYKSELYVLPDEPTLEILEVLPNPSDCATSDISVTCHAYIKVKNTGNVEINLSDYRLRGGSSNSRDSSLNVSTLAGAVARGKVAIIGQQADGSLLNITKDAGTIWFQDRHGLTNYNNDMTPYEKATNAGNTGRSWAYDQSTKAWRWANPSPTTEVNDFSQISAGKGAISSTSQLKPCRDDQYRSEETNRCRSIVVNTSAKTPCKAGQYRSEETGRCRSLTTASASLKPCAEDQFRNPSTGRCKKIASTEDLLAPCKDGWTRNPETNRCRKNATASSALAAYPVEKIHQSTTDKTIWWTIIAILCTGIAYAAWEWRSEIGRTFRKIGFRAKK